MTTAVESKPEAKPEFERTSPLRKPVVIKVELSSRPEPVFVKEWTAKNLFAMIGFVETIVDKLVEHEVLSLKPSTVEPNAVSMSEAEARGIRNVKMTKGIMRVIADSQSEVYSMLKGSVYADSEAKKLVDQAYLEELTLGDIVTLGKAVWHVNWELGSLGKAGALRDMISSKTV